MGDDARPEGRFTTDAIEGAEPTGGGGGGGACSRGAGAGKGGALDGGGGGGAPGANDVGRGGGGAGAPDGRGGGGGAGDEGSVGFNAGFREVGKAGGFFPIGGGGPLPLVFLRPPGPGASKDGLPGIVGAPPDGGGGAEAGGLGTDSFDSPGSDTYEESASRPVFTPPPLFFSLGMPPANRPPSCGAADSSPAEATPVPWSLLLLARFPGTGGARPGTGGAPPTAGPDDDVPPPATAGAERSFVTAFLRALPLPMSARRAPYRM